MHDVPTAVADRIALARELDRRPEQPGSGRAQMA
jgi:hypothetical protein